MHQPTGVVVVMLGPFQLFSNYDVCSFVFQSHSYLMYGALDGNRLCLLSLGNKHVFGLDGIPTDLEQAYG